jgi:hypothetical protein
VIFAARFGPASKVSGIDDVIVEMTQCCLLADVRLFTTLASEEEPLLFRFVLHSWPFADTRTDKFS